MRFMDQVCTGPSCRFGDAHIYYVLHLLGENGRTSRSNMSALLNIGEGSTRGLCELLREWGMLDVCQFGMTLSEYGRQFLQNIPMRLVPVPRSDYVIGTFQRGVVVSKASQKVTDGMYQRDRAIIAGADGASVFLMEGGDLIMPKNWNMDVRDPGFSEKVRDMTSMKDGEILIISGASDPDVATIASIATGLDML